MTAFDSSSERKLRYRALLEDLYSLNDATSNREAVDRTKTILEEASRLLNDGEIADRVQHPGESLLDSKVMLATSHVINRCSNSVSGNSNVYDPAELADHMKMNPDYWASVPMPREIPNYTYLFGTFAPGPPIEKQAKPRRQIERQKMHSKVEPENVTLVENVEEGSEMVVRAKKFLSRLYKKNGSKPINFFKLVLDPHDFAHTVENIYHLSFLVRDGFVSITIDATDNLPYISPVSKEEQEKQKNDPKSENKQFILSLDMTEWQQAVKTFNVKECLMNIKTDQNDGR